jgi:hypothetical protein
MFFLPLCAARNMASSGDCVPGASEAYWHGEFRGDFDSHSCECVEMHDGGLSLCDRDACLPVVIGLCGATVPQYTFGGSVGNGFAAVWMLEFMRVCCCDRSVGWWCVSGVLVALCDACVTCGWWSD